MSRYKTDLGNGSFKHPICGLSVEKESTRLESTHEDEGIYKDAELERGVIRIVKLAQLLDEMRAILT